MVKTISDNKIKINNLAKFQVNTTLTVDKEQHIFLLEKLFASNKNISHKSVITLEENSKVTYFLALFGGAVVNKDIEIVLEGRGSEAKILGVYFGRQDQKYNFKVVSQHNGSQTRALTWINGVLTDKSSSDFDGLVKITKDLHQVDSYLANHVLVLGNEAKANAIPSLEIESNDVKCSHEATVGQIDENHLFYLMSRGLSRNQAEKLLINGFLESVLNKVENMEFRDLITNELNNYSRVKIVQ